MENRTFNPVITPNIPQPEQPPEFVNTEQSEASLPLKDVEVMAYIGVDAGNIEDMEKVSEIADFIKNSGDTIEEIDLKLGNPYNMTRLDKIYNYVRLQQHSARVRQQDQLLQRELQKYGTRL